MWPDLRRRPTMRDILGLRPAPAAETALGATRSDWGNPQRFLVAGLAVLLLSAIAASILYLQFPAHFPGIRSPEEVRQRIKQMSIQETRIYFHRWIEPGIEISEGTAVDSKRGMAYFGMVAAGAVAAIGLILIGIGLALRAGTRRRRIAPAPTRHGAGTP